MKYINIKVLFIAIVVAFSACNDDVLNQEDPDSVTTDNYWKNQADAKAAVMEVYSYLSYNGWMFGEADLATLMYRGDDIEMRSGALSWSYLSSIGKFSNKASCWPVREYWRQRYRGLNRANWVIFNVSKVSENEITEDASDNIKGEALFLRGLNHFLLLQNFYKIVLKLEYVTSIDGLNGELSSREDSYIAIEKDLKDAIELLPETWGESNLGRATKNSARGFLGKVLLSQKKFNEAHLAFETIVNRELVTNYESLFDGSNENSEESIFEIQFNSQYIGSLGKVHSGSSTIATAELNGWDMFRPSVAIMTAYKEEKTVNNKTDNRFYGCVVSDDAESTLFGATKVITGRSFKKFMESNVSITSGDSGVNYPLMRYADVLLMHAEALCETSPADALVPLNKVRNRAGLADFTDVNKDNLRKEIRKQRFLELSCEGIRWYDLVRWGVVKETLTANGKVYAADYNQDKNEYFPIPTNEVQNNPEVDQVDQWK